MDQTSSKIRSVILTVTCLMVLSLIVQIIGFATPGWLRLEFKDNSMSVQTGMWYVRSCVQSICVTMAIDELDGQFRTSAMSQLTTYRALTTTGIVLALLCLPVFVYAVRKLSVVNRQRTAILFIGAFLALLSGILAISAAGKFGDKLRKAHEAFDGLEKYGIESPYGYPYSLVITGLGGVTAVIAALILACSGVAERPSEGTSGQTVQVQTPAYIGQDKTTMYPMAVAHPGNMAHYQPPSY